ncbi:MAG: hypothetical protein JSS81_26055 [Acidobacteria bacterium]|nr:hypothetical protein [Acidobacteriota bacterium]
MIGTVIDRAGDSFVSRVFRLNLIRQPGEQPVLSAKNTNNTKFLSGLFSVFGVFRGPKNNRSPAGLFIDLYVSRRFVSNIIKSPFEQ